MAKPSKKLPDDVLRVKEALCSAQDHELKHVASRLIQETPELISMWRLLERRKSCGDAGAITGS